MLGAKEVVSGSLANKDALKRLVKMYQHKLSIPLVPSVSQEILVNSTLQTVSAVGQPYILYSGHRVVICLDRRRLPVINPTSILKP